MTELGTLDARPPTPTPRDGRRLRRWSLAMLILLTAGCEGVMRDCSSWWASDVTGADWIVVQLDMNGETFNCWRLEGSGVSSETNSDGIYWLTSDGHLVHVSGWYNYVQVQSEAWRSAAEAVGIDLRKCGGGRYPRREPPRDAGPH